MKRIIELLAGGVTDDTGVYLDSGKVYFYSAGTTERKTVYKDFELTDPHPNPATLNAAGRLIAYSDTRLRLAIEDSLGTLVHTWDHIGTSGDDLAVTANTQGLAGNGLTINQGDSTLEVSVDGETLTLENGVVKVATHGISGDEISQTPVIETSIQIGEEGPILSKAASFLQVSQGLNLNGLACELLGASPKMVKQAGQAIVVSANPPGLGVGGLMIVRGSVDLNGNVIGGEGFTAVRNSTGVYTVTWDVPFAVAPIVTFGFLGSSAAATHIMTNGITTTTMLVHIFQSVAYTNWSFSFIAIGQRA